MSMPKRTYDYRDLVRIYIKKKRFENAAPGLRDYYAELYNILRRFFGADLDQLADPEDRRTDSPGYGHLFERCLESCLGVYSPFGGYLEAPREICDLYEGHGKKMNNLVDQYKDACFDLMCEIYVLVYGKTDKKITSGELCKRGFDDSEEPDELDFI